MGINSRFLNLDTDVTLSSNSDEIIPSQKAIKTYADNKLIFFGTSTTAKATVQKEVSIPSITSLETGTIIVVQPTITSTVANSTIKLNNFIAYPMRYNNAAITTDTDSVVWNANYPCMWVFDGEYWKLLAKGLDSNTTYTLNYLIDAGVARAGGTTSSDYAVSRYSLVMQKPDGTLEKITSMSATYSTATNKSVNTNGFLPYYIKYYNSTTAIAGLANIGANTLRVQTGSVDMRYSTNCGDTPAWTQGETIYLVGTITDGLFYLDTTTWWSNALPNTNNGKYYIRVGYVVTTDSYNCSLLVDHPIFYHDGTGIKQYTGTSSGGSSITADGTTIVDNSGTISTVAIKEQRASTAIKEWVGTKAQYDAITTKDSNTKYVITDDEGVGLVIDGALSTTSTNAVENRVVTNAIQNMATAKTRFTGEIIESSVPLTDAGLHLLDGSVIIGNGSYSAFVTYMAAKVSTNPEIFTTEANWQQSITDYGVCSKFVYSSGDNSIRLPKTFNDERFLIDSYNSNGSWYNVYSDGWCEQGQIISISSSAVITINLLKEFADTNYCVFKNYGSQNDSTAMDREVSLANKTTSSFTTYCNTNDTSSIDIMACGYIDITTLQENPLYKYIVIANVTNTQVEVDINEVFSDLNDKVSISDLGEIQCVIEEYSLGSSWYRIYSDGWCEQGGRTVASSGTGFETVTLLKPYTNTNYSLSVTNLSGASRGDYRGGSIVDDSTITVGYDNGQSSWETKGYIS